MFFFGNIDTNNVNLRQKLFFTNKLLNRKNPTYYVAIKLQFKFGFYGLVVFASFRKRGSRNVEIHGGTWGAYNRSSKETYLFSILFWSKTFSSELSNFFCQRALRLRYTRAVSLCGSGS